MKQHRYFGYETHHHEHEVFTKRVLKYQAEFRDANKSIPLQLTAFLKDWLEHHILQTDKRLGLYLNTCGVR